MGRFARWAAKRGARAARGALGGPRATRRGVAKAVAAYLACALCSSYAVTAACTPASFMQPGQVVEVLKEAGAINLLSGGIAQPALAAGRLLAAQALSAAQGALGDDSLGEIADRLASEASYYFDEALGAAGDWAQAALSAPRPPDVAPSASGSAHVEWDERLWPQCVRLIDEPVSVDVALEAGQVIYFGLDGMGRTLRAVANVDASVLERSSGWRAGFAAGSDPAGWPAGRNPEVEVDFGDSTYRGYAYNRSHLIADSLGGYQAVFGDDGEVDRERSLTPRENLVCATRAQNVGSNGAGGAALGGMAYFEQLVRDYLAANPYCSVWYSATPYYAGDDDLLPTSVFVAARSCDGGLDVQGEVYNALPGYEVDYRDATLYDAAGAPVNPA